VGQEAIAQTLTNAIRSEKIAPAYLFTGPRGTGKTSSARIMAKSLNCLTSDRPTETPCGQCDVCQGIAKGSTLDVIEIDAASNTGVDNIRELIERAQFAPVQCRYKVYVIDEVHMLSVSAFNALLKTLEEPPKNVVFILATTDPQRVLPTIISRCQRFDFGRIPLEAMVSHLQHIAEKESINITLEAIQMVAQIAQGGLRDAESLLDQLSLMTEQITVEGVWDLVGAVPERDLMALLEAIASDNPTTVLDVTRQIMDRGREPLIVLQNLAAFYRDLLIAKTAPERSNLVALTKPTWDTLCQFSRTWELPTILGGQTHLQDSEVQIKNTTQPRLWLEVTLLGLLPSALHQKFVTETVVQQLPPQPQTTKQTTTIPRETSPQSPPKASHQTSPTNLPPPTSVEKDLPSSKSVEPQAEKKSVPPDETVSSDKSNLEPIWQRVVGTIKRPSTQEFLRQKAKLIDLRDRVARVSMPNQALLRHLTPQKIANIEAAFSQVLNYPVKVKVEVAGSNTANDVSANYYASGDKSKPSSNGIKNGESSNVVEPIDSNNAQSLQRRYGDEEGREDREAVAIASQKLVEFFDGKIVNFPGEIELEPITDGMSFSGTVEMPKEELKADYKEPELENNDDVYEEEEEEDDDVPF
jgi:DNA polymerase-3 subunit gamma/tau